MKVTRVLCDRCETELAEDRAEREGLEMRLDYEPRGREPSLIDRISPFGSSQQVDLCPDCREAFADWLGERGRELPGLVAPEEPEGSAPEDQEEVADTDETQPSGPNVKTRPV